MGKKMLKNRMETSDWESYITSLFLPKYKRIIQELYLKTQGNDEETNMDIQTIPTIEELNKLDLNNSLN